MSQERNEHAADHGQDDGSLPAISADPLEQVRVLAAQFNMNEAGQQLDNIGEAIEVVAETPVDVVVGVPEEPQRVLELPTLNIVPAVDMTDRQPEQAAPVAETASMRDEVDEILGEIAVMLGHAPSEVRDTVGHLLGKLKTAIGF